MSSFAEPIICNNLERALLLSLKYQFVTPLTSLVVIKPDVIEDGDIQVRESLVKFVNHSIGTIVIRVGDHLIHVQGVQKRYQFSIRKPFSWTFFLTKYICLRIRFDEQKEGSFIKGMGDFVVS